MLRRGRRRWGWWRFWRGWWGEVCSRLPDHDANGSNLSTQPLPNPRGVPSILT